MYSALSLTHVIITEGFGVLETHLILSLILHLQQQSIVWEDCMWDCFFVCFLLLLLLLQLLSCSPAGHSGSHPVQIVHWQPHSIGWEDRLSDCFLSAHYVGIQMPCSDELSPLLEMPCSDELSPLLECGSGCCLQELIMVEDSAIIIMLNTYRLNVLLLQSYFRKMDKT